MIWQKRTPLRYIISNADTSLASVNPLATQRLNVNKFITPRQEGLDMLHQQQIKLLRQWRELQHLGKQEEAEKLLVELFLTVNAISGGLRTTG
ncbi:MAG: phosphoenolpyruvate carboxylase [Chlorobium sp.]|nr:MAG: phosphoenolpyruvate carboxylase [Chlorobium sp.]